MKKLLVLMMAFCLALGCVACGEKEVATEIEESVYEVEKEDFLIEPKGCITYSEEGYNYALIESIFTNEAEETCSPADKVLIKVFQDGIELYEDFPYLSNEELLELQNHGSTSIKTGVSLNFVNTFELNNTESPIEVEWVLMNDNSKVLHTETYELNFE